MLNLPKLLLGTVLCCGLIGPASAAIYVENLSPDVTEKELTALFSNHGQVMQVDLVKDSDTGEFKGAGFVHMGNFSMELEAINSLQGKKLNGKKMKVSKSRARTYGKGVFTP